MQLSIPPDYFRAHEMSSRKRMQKLTVLDASEILFNRRDLQMGLPLFL